MYKWIIGNCWVDKLLKQYSRFQFKLKNCNISDFLNFTFLYCTHTLTTNKKFVSEYNILCIWKHFYSLSSFLFYWQILIIAERIFSKTITVIIVLVILLKKIQKHQLDLLRIKASLLMKMAIRLLIYCLKHHVMV